MSASGGPRHSASASWADLWSPAAQSVDIPLDRHPQFVAVRARDDRGAVAGRSQRLAQLRPVELNELRPFEFTHIETGQTFVLRDPSGRALFRDRGRARVTLLFDTLGDDTPGREASAVLDVDLDGSHPGFLYHDERRFSSIVQQLLG